jgi:hypothetical protein
MRVDRRSVLRLAVTSLGATAIATVMPKALTAATPTERIICPTQVFDRENGVWTPNPGGLTNIKRGAIFRMQDPDTGAHIPCWGEDGWLDGSWFAVTVEDGKKDPNGPGGIVNVDWFADLDDALAHAAKLSVAA